jgi:putative tryptophan/tyrosine transport system substrate-binding protein
MKRREFITVVGGAAAMRPFAAHTQQPTNVARMGWMSRGNATTIDPNLDAFRQGMREFGYVEKQSSAPVVMMMGTRFVFSLAACK